MPEPSSPLRAVAFVPREGGVRFEVHVKPRAARSAVVGARGQALDVALAAPPVDGAANDELVEFLSRALGIRKRDVAILRGEASRHKLVEVRSLTPEEIRARLQTRC
jgi:uncharacterized protein